MNQPLGEKTEVLVGFDVGTSSLKVTIVDATSGKIIDNRRYNYQGFYEMAPGVVPVKIYKENASEVIRKLWKEFHLMAVAISTQMYSVCGMIQGELCAYQWNCLWETVRHKEDEFREDLRKSGCPVDSIYGAYKLATLKEEERKNFFPYGLKEWLIRELTGQLCSDYVTASASGLFDIHKKDWNRSFIQRMGFEASMIPEIYKHDQVCGKLRKEWMEGNPGETLVVPGLGDGVSASYACKDVSSFCGNVGTSMAARVITPRIDQASGVSVWTYAIDDETYATGGISPNSCSVFTWSGKLGFDIAEEACLDDSLLFFPWIHGERVPYWTSDIKGTFLGLKSDTNKEQISMTILKGISYTFSRMESILASYCQGNAPLVLAGGAANSKAVLRVVAGTIDRDIAMVNDADYLCSTGAAMSAGQALGIQVTNNIAIDYQLKPTGEFMAEYEKWLRLADHVAKLYDISLNG